MSFPAEKLMEKFQYALDNDWGYIYGKTHEMWSAAKQEAYVREWEGDSDRANSCKYGGKWAGHWVTDCSGLFAWSYSQLGGKIVHGSNSIWNGYLTSKGTLRAGARTDGQTLLPGTAVFTSSGDRHNHIGLYIGGDTVIEAQGAQAGVTTTKISNKKWTHWGELKGVLYREKGGIGMYAKVILPSGSKGNTVNMRAKADRASTVLDRVPVGATVEVLSTVPSWCQIRYGGLEGWMMSDYLDRDGQEAQDGQEQQQGASGGDVVTPEDMARMEAALKEIENQLEVIRSTLGRG